MPPPEGEGGPGLFHETRLATGEICRVRFGAAAAESLLADSAASAGEPVPARAALVDADGREIAVFGQTVTDAVGGEAPVPRTNVRLVAEWPTAAVARGGARRLVLLGGCLLALLVCSLFAGGALLVRAARRERLDALRKTDFVDNVSHELKTPLAGIRLSAELLAEGRLPEGPRRDRALRSILAESDRLDRLVSNLLDFGRLERGGRRFDLRRVDLSALLEELRNAQCAMRKDNGPAADPAADHAALPASPTTLHSSLFTLHCERGLAAFADPDALRQILVNLLDNAAKYAGEGGPPDVSAREAGDGVVSLAVADRGPGVPRGLEEKVFERFYRVDNATNRRTNGSGIGLSLARGLARGMGGDLVCRAREGGGAVFELTLPAAGEN